MKVSIVIPCFNNSRYLPLCLDSTLRNMANRDGEIICVDDYSSDDTIEILETYAKKHDSIKIVKHKENRGTNEARRSGVLAASGDYILFQDQDDRLREGIIDVLEETLAKRDVDVLFFDFTFTDGFSLENVEQGNSKVKYFRQIKKGHLLATDKISALRAIYSSTPRLGVMVWARAWKRELLLNAFKLIPAGWCVEQEDDCESLMFLTLAESVEMIDYVGYEYKWDTGVTNEDIDERNTMRYLRNAVFVTRFQTAFKKHFGDDSQYKPYLHFVDNNVLDKYRKISNFLLKSVENREEILERQSFGDERTQMLAMLCFERESEYSRMPKAIGSIPFFNLLLKFRRMYLKLCMKLFGSHKSLESERMELKKVRALFRG